MTGKIFQSCTFYCTRTLSQRVIITRSRDRKIRSCEQNCDRQGDFPKRVQLGRFSGAVYNGWNFIGNKYFLLLQPCTVTVRAVSKALSVSLARSASIR